LPEQEYLGFLSVLNQQGYLQTQPDFVKYGGCQSSPPYLSTSFLFHEQELKESKSTTQKRKKSKTKGKAVDQQKDQLTSQFLLQVRILSLSRVTRLLSIKHLGIKGGLRQSTLLLLISQDNFSLSQLIFLSFQISLSNGSKLRLMRTEQDILILK